MQNRRARKSSLDEPSLFGPPEQPDLFANTLSRSDIYIPKQPHVRSALKALLEGLRALDSWASCESYNLVPYRERRGPYLVGLITDKEEAEDWRRQIDAEIARLNAAETV